MAKEIVEKFGEEFERTGDGWLHSVNPDKDGEYTMTPDTSSSENSCQDESMDDSDDD